MVRLVHQTQPWEALKKNIQDALLLSPQLDPSLILHLGDDGHFLEKIEVSSSFCLAPPYEEPGFIHRLTHSNAGQENLLKAIGCRKGEKPSVIDATAGFGLDSLIMAHYGCHVSCIEWNPLICFLVENTLSRVALHSTFSFISEFLQYYQNDARLLIPELPAHDVIYLDPMFPERRKQAKVKKYMQMMQMIAPLYPWAQQNEKTLFDIALLYAKKRVVVKRPKTEPPIAPNPNHSILSQSIRFDVYMTHG